jgi:murein DD-endopeptidase MepM/ murein hydrolase activator NlpD
MSDDNVTLTEVHQGNVTYVVAHLGNCTDATITVTATMDNMRASGPVPLTVDTAGQRDGTLIAFAPLDASRSYRFYWHFAWKYGGRARGAPAPYRYVLPYHDGSHRVSQGPGGAFSHGPGSQNEEAIDFLMPVGTNVFPARPGVVAAFRSDSDTGGVAPGNKSDANYVVVRHNDGTYAEYVHLKRDGILVRLGQHVSTADPIALSGNTGYSTEPHLHFCVFNNVDGTTRRTIPVTFVWPSGVTFKPVQGQDY